MRRKNDLTAQQAMQLLIDDYGFELEDEGWYTRGENVYIGRRGNYLDIRVVFLGGYVQFRTNEAKISKGNMILGISMQVVIEKIKE